MPEVYLFFIACFPGRLLFSLHGAVFCNAQKALLSILAKCHFANLVTAVETSRRLELVAMLALNVFWLPWCKGPVVYDSYLNWKGRYVRGNEVWGKGTR